MFDSRKKILIIYKSGYKQTIRVKKLKITQNDEGKLLSISWEYFKPNPMFIGIKDIESIWVVK